MHQQQQKRVCKSLTGRLSWESCSLLSRKDRGKWLRNCSLCSLVAGAAHGVNAASSNVIFRLVSLALLQNEIVLRKVKEAEDAGQ